MLAHQPRLLAVARHGGCDRDQAQGVVHDAFLRVIAHPALDAGRLQGLLVTTVRHLTVDLHRREGTQHKLGHHHGLLPVTHPSPDDRICDIAHGQWLQHQLPLLRSTEKQVLLARSHGQTPSAIATEMQVTVKAVELLARRARAHLRRLDDTQKKSSETRLGA